MLQKGVIILFMICSCRGVDAQTRALDIFKSWDKNGDGVLVPSEVPIELRSLFPRNDRNSDGKITVREHIIAMGRPAPMIRPTTTIEEFRIRQVWHQETGGWGRRVLLRKPVSINKKLPVVIFFHGNGGQVQNAIEQFGILSDVIFVCPQGYRRSWNVYGEASEAPDVEFVGEIIEYLRRREPDANLNNITLIGSSNGGGLIHRILIEMERKPFQKAVCLMSSLIAQQYHDGSFWTSSKGGANLYDLEKHPVRGPKVVYFHGTEDRICPYMGGNRGSVVHLSAQRTAYAFAEAYGFKGDALQDTDGRVISPGIYLYDYPEASYKHYKLQGEGHGIARYREFVDTTIRNLVLE